MLAMLSLLTLVLFGSPAFPPPVAPQDGALQERVVLVPMLLNGDFDLAQEPTLVPGGVPWWIGGGGGVRVQTADDTNWLVTKGGAVASQPIPAYAPLVDQLVVRGRVTGAGLLTLVDGAGRRTEWKVGTAGASETFEFSGAELTRTPDAPPLPRFTLELRARNRGTAGWTDLEVLAALPCPDEAALRTEVVALLHESLDPWIERGLDVYGPRETGLVAALFDAVTGEVITTHASSMHPLMETLLEATRHEPDPLWSAVLERYVGDFLELCLNPDTGLPRLWDPVKDVPLDRTFQEIHLAFGFLLDLADHGPQTHRERALAAATKIGESVLATGILPDGNVAPLYRPSDGLSSNEARSLRRLDTPSRLVLLARETGDERLLVAARDAVATVLYTHYWPGTWNRIDPGFDDDFGHYAERSVVMARAFPDEPLFRRLVDTGWEKFDTLWPQALRYGGSMAADQVRCWKLLIEYSELRPDLRPALDAVLGDAIHSHLRGQQYGNGAWGDITYNNWQPAVDLQVGDFSGTPTNLLQGIANVYGSGLGPDDETLRAIFTAVLRSSVATYGREYGLLSTMRQLDGANHAGGSLRIGPALTVILGKLGGG